MLLLAPHVSLTPLYRHGAALTDPGKQLRQSLRLPSGETVDRDPARAGFGHPFELDGPLEQSLPLLPWAPSPLLPSSTTACWIPWYSWAASECGPRPIGPEPPVQWRSTVSARLRILASLATATIWPLLRRFSQRPP